MTNQLEKIKKIGGRSLNELLTRGGQVVSAYSEQIGFGAGVPTDEQFRRYIDISQFGSSPIIGESLWQKFYKNADQRFFKSFIGDTAAAFRATIGEDSGKHFTSRAELIIPPRRAA